MAYLLELIYDIFNYVIHLTFVCFLIELIKNNEILIN